MLKSASPMKSINQSINTCAWHVVLRTSQMCNAPPHHSRSTCAVLSAANIVLKDLNWWRGMMEGISPSGKQTGLSTSSASNQQKQRFVLTLTFVVSERNKTLALCCFTEIHSRSFEDGQEIIIIMIITMIKIVIIIPKSKGKKVKVKLFIHLSRKILWSIILGSEKLSSVF